MKTVILCGGKGTRIRDVAVETPKPLVPIGEHPILLHLMRYYALWGRKDFVLCLGYKSSEIIDYFRNIAVYSQDSVFSYNGRLDVELLGEPAIHGWSVTMSHTGVESQTGTRVARIRRYVEQDSDFMLTYADGLSDVDLDRLLAFHRSHGKIMTVTGVTPPGRFGEMLTDPDGRVTEFTEKPHCSSGLVSGGFMVCRTEIFDYLDPEDDYMLEREPMQRLARDGQMMVWPHAGFWHPMDAPRDYAYLNDLYLKGNAPWTRKP